MKSLRRLRQRYRLRKAPLLGSLSVLCWTWPIRKSSCKMLSRSWKSGSITNFGCFRRSPSNKMPSRKTLPRFLRNIQARRPTTSARGGNWAGTRNLRRWMKVKMTWRTWSTAPRETKSAPGSAVFSSDLVLSEIPHVRYQ